MNRFKPGFGIVLFSAALLLGALAVLLFGEDALPAARGVVEKGREAVVASGSYSKMAVLAAREPDARLAMPVRGVRTKQVADTWGGERAGGRTHKGQDIFARRGTPVYSATEGYVLHVGESELGGKVIFVYGAGGRRYYYAHLDDFAPGLKTGDHVTTESLLGFVGTTGNAKNTPPHLHFGVYTSGGAINPLPLLSDRN